MQEKTEYNKAFYDAQSSGSWRSAQEILPPILSLFRVRSAIDVGCGIGTWLRAALEAGVSDITGLDGHYVDRNALLIPSGFFQPHDLEASRLGEAPTLTGGRRFDLAMSLEVAEHLSFARAESFVDDLTSLSDVVLFGAAAPFQGGAHHVNEQWPEFWAMLFRNAGYVCHDVVRPRAWNNRNVEWWYAQNTFLFIKEGSSAAKLMDAPPTSSALALVHPLNYLNQLLTTFRPHRFTAYAEEVADYEALTKAYLAQQPSLPDLQAIARAKAHPNSPDVFPLTRTQTSIPEEQIAHMEAQLRALHDRLDWKTIANERKLMSLIEDLVTRRLNNQANTTHIPDHAEMKAEISSLNQELQTLSAYLLKLNRALEEACVDDEWSIGTSFELDYKRGGARGKLRFFRQLIRKMKGKSFKQTDLSPEANAVLVRAWRRQVRAAVPIDQGKPPNNQ